MTVTLRGTLQGNTLHLRHASRTPGTLITLGGAISLPIVIAYLSGWSVVWETSIFPEPSAKELFALIGATGVSGSFGEGFHLGVDSMIVRVGRYPYGLVSTDRVFSSPMIRLLGLCASVLALASCVAWTFKTPKRT